MVLVSHGADQFDPDSLLDGDGGSGGKQPVPISLVILSLLSPTDSEPFKIAGLFDEIHTGPGRVVLRFRPLMQMALELSRFVLARDSTNIESLEIRLELLDPLVWELSGFVLKSVRLGHPENNKVRAKVVLVHESI